MNLVCGLVEAGRAQCIIGNHELNLLRRQRKDGNDWFYGRREDDEGQRVFDEILDSDDAREDMLGFFNSLPMVLHRDDLRVVHACWDDASIEQVNRPATPIELFHEHERVLREEIDPGHARVACYGKSKPLEMNFAHRRTCQRHKMDAALCSCKGGASPVPVARAAQIMSVRHCI